MDCLVYNGEIAKKTEFDGYYVTKSGILLSIKIKGAHGKMDYTKPRPHSVKTDKDGYLEACISMMINGKQKRIYKRVHRLVWETFNGKIKDDLTIDHINKNTADNRLENLRLLTREENTSIAVKGIKSHKRFLYQLFKNDIFCGIYDRRELQTMFNFNVHYWYKDNKAEKKIRENGYLIKLVESVEDIERIA